MKTHNALQGSVAWHALRASVDGTASEAPAMMGASKYQSRDDLIARKATGIVPEVSGQQQVIFNRGHDAEASIRPHIETTIGEDLYPITGSIEIDGLHLLASFDGLTADDSIGFEHKLYSAELFDCVKSSPDDLHMHYVWQMEQQLLVSGAEYILFVVSDGTPQKCATMKYYPVPGRREQLIAGWNQLKVDVANYEPREPEAEVIAAAQTQLPAVSVRLDGQIAVISNLTLFGRALTEYVDGLNLVPETDQEFADLEAACKNLKKAEDALAASEDNALAQLEDVEQMRRAVAQYREVARQARLSGEKAVKAQKSAIKVKIAYEAKAQFDEHIATLNKALGGQYMPAIATNFNEAMKNKRTVDSLRSAANDESARARIEANRISSRIEQNLETLNTVASAHKFLFRDEVQLVQQHEPEALKAIVKQRVMEHEETERKREEQIRADEKAKVEREAAAKKAEEDRLAEAKAREAAQPAEVSPAATTSVTTAQAASGQVFAQVATEAPATYASNVSTITGRRPTDDQIIEVLALHYRVHESKVIEWLLSMDLESASKRIVEAV